MNGSYQELGGPGALVRISPGVDIRTLEVDAHEGMVLAMIGDGIQVKQLCRLSPLGEASTLALLGRMRAQGVIEVTRPGGGRAGNGRPGSKKPQRRAGKEHHRDEVQLPLWLKRDKAGSKAHQGRMPFSGQGAKPSQPGTGQTRGRVTPQSRVRDEVAKRLAKRGKPLPRRKQGPREMKVELADGTVKTIRRVLVEESPPPKSRIGPSRHHQERRTISQLDAVTEPGPSRKPTVPIPDDPFQDAQEFRAATPAPDVSEKMAASLADLDPDILAERVELDEDLKRLLLYLHDRLPRMSYYEILAVPKDADRKTIRKAFKARTKLLHPDRYFRKRLGSYEAMLHDLFKAASQAYDVLSDPQKRSIYDLTYDKTRKLMGSRNTVDQATHAAQLYEEAKEKADQGDFDWALRAIGQACELEPGEDRYRVLMHRIQKVMKRLDASKVYAQAVQFIRQRRYHDAIPLLEQTVELAPEPEVLLLLARCIERAGGPVDKAIAYARRAREKAPDNQEAAALVSRLSNESGARYSRPRPPSSE